MQRFANNARHVVRLSKRMVQRVEHSGSRHSAEKPRTSMSTTHDDQASKPDTKETRSNCSLDWISRSEVTAGREVVEAKRSEEMLVRLFFGELRKLKLETCANLQTVTVKRSSHADGEAAGSGTRCNALCYTGGSTSVGDSGPFRSASSRATAVAAGGESAARADGSAVRIRDGVSSPLRGEWWSPSPIVARENKS